MAAVGWWERSACSYYDEEDGHILEGYNTSTMCYICCREGTDYKLSGWEDYCWADYIVDGV